MASDRLQRQIERLLDEADRAITEEDWSTVSSRARSVLAIDPENMEGLAYLATAERAVGVTGSPSTSEPQSKKAATIRYSKDRSTSFIIASWLERSGWSCRSGFFFT